MESDEIKTENDPFVTCSLCEGQNIALSNLAKHVLDMHGLVLKSRIINSESQITNIPQISALKFYAKLIKVEKVLKGRLHLIPSPSVKSHIMGGKVCLRCKGKTLLGVVNKLLKTKSLLTSPSNVLPYYLKETFLPII